MFIISKIFKFEAAHNLLGLPAGHKCATKHGHSYSVTVFLKNPALNSYGFVFDYNDFDFFKNFIDKNLDHQDLNEVLNIQPTAENIAKYLFEWIANYFKQSGFDASLLSAVEVKETEKTCARYEH